MHWLLFWRPPEKECQCISVYVSVVFNADVVGAASWQEPRSHGVEIDVALSAAGMEVQPGKGFVVCHESETPWS